jgi:hypothetical protein
MLPVIFWSCNDDEEPNNGEENNNGSNIVVVDYFINEPRTWSSDSIYLLPNGVKIDAALTIEAGTIIKIGPLGCIEVWNNGTINAVGTSSSPIVFTSIKDDSKGGDVNNDAGATTPVMGDWTNIDLGYSNGSNFRYCEFYFGGNSDHFGVLNCGTGTSTIDNCIFAFNDAYIHSDEFCGALYAHNADDATTITGNTFYGNKVPMTIDSHISLDNSNVFEITIDSETITNTYNGIFVLTQDIMSTNVTWEEKDVAFVITYGSLELWENFTLTLGNDVVLKFTNGAGLDLQNASTLINYNGSGVYFTSYKDDTKKGDTNGDGDATSPLTGDWDGVYNSDTYAYFSWSNIYYAEN